jgi:hypothetical protein
MNIGFFSGPFMAFAAALDISTRKSPTFSFPLVSPPVVCHLDMYCTKVIMYRTMVLMARPTKVRR